MRKPEQGWVRWALWSPTRALKVGGGLLAGACVLTAFIPSGGSDARAEAAHTTRATHAATAPAPVTLPPVPTLPQPTAPTLPTPTIPAPILPSPSARATDPKVAARAFVDAWLSGHGARDKAAWVTRVAAHTEPSLLPFLQATALDAIPAARITAARVTKTDKQAALVDVTLSDKTVLQVSLVDDAGSWTVATFQPAGQ